MRISFEIFDGSYWIFVLSVVKSLTEKHNKFLKKLHLIYRKVFPNTNTIELIGSCKNLTGLTLRNIQIDESVQKTLDRLDNLAYLKLFYGNCFIVPMNQLIITKPKLTLKKLYLGNIIVSREVYEAISKFCPNLELIYLYNCQMDDECMYSFFKSLIDLKYIYIIYHTITPSVTFEFLKEAPHKILPNMKLLILEILTELSQNLVS